MTHIIKTITFFFFISTLSYTQTGWYWQNPLPQGNLIGNISFVNKDLGWATAGFGTLLKTTDGGTTWTPVKSKINETVWDISFVDDMNGTLMGTKIIQSTTDGGETWFEHSFNGVEMHHVTRFDALSGIIVGVDSVGLILKTSDGGITWSRKDAGTSERLYNMTYLDSLRAYIVGVNKGLFKTTDAGNTWEKVAELPCEISDIKFLDTNIVVAAGASIIRSTDGGLSWDTVYSSVFTEISFINKNYGFAVRSRNSMSTNNILKTTDAGLTWSEVSSPDMYEICITDTNKFIGINYTPHIYLSSDGGVNWEKLTKGFSDNLNDIFFVNDSSAYTAGYNGTILHTTNAGVNWSKQESNTQQNLMGITFANANLGVAVGYSGTILRTTDGGINWLPQNSNVNSRLLSVLFLDSVNCIATGDSGTIIKSTDGGISWTEKESGTDYYIYNIKRTLDFIYAAIPSGGWVKSNDWGNTWTFFAQNDYQFISVVFLDDNKGFGVSIRGKIYSTSDGGISWNDEGNKAVPLRDICFTDDFNGWAVGSGIILRTKDGGKNWNEQDIPTHNVLVKVAFTDKNHGTVVGAYGTILRTNYGGLTGVNNSNEEMPSSFKLEQNYPNPFNPVTNFRFSVAQDKGINLVTLKVYDLLGREVAVLVNEEKQPGEYEIAYNASNLSSGVYFYTLSSGNFQQTKKFVLLK